MIVGLKTWPHDEHKQLIATAGWSWVDEHTLSYRRSPKKATVRSPASPPSICYRRRAREYPWYFGPHPEPRRLL